MLGRARPSTARCWRRSTSRHSGEGEHGGQYANLVVSANAETGGPIHIAFVARSRDEVDAFHRSGVEAGYRDNGAPGVREHYSSKEAGRYYAAFLLDPDGNNVEAVIREF